MNKIMQKFKSEYADFKMLLRNVPSSMMALFTISVVLMNLLANKSVDTNTTWLALDCGFTLSWLSFLSMDMLTKRFGAKASIKLSLFAIGVNLIACAIFYIVSIVPGWWGEYYTFGNSDIVNVALNSTIGGTWYILLGSAIAFIISAIVNSVLNENIGKLFKHNNFKAYAVRSYVSTTIGQFVDNFVFALIVSHTFFGWTMIQCITCAITGAVIELICEIIFSPIGYKVCKKWESENVGELYFKFKKEAK